MSHYRVGEGLQPCDQATFLSQSASSGLQRALREAWGGAARVASGSPSQAENRGVVDHHLPSHLRDEGNNKRRGVCFGGRAIKEQH